MIVVMFVAGLFLPEGRACAPQEAYASGAFMKGFVEGYNTMDAWRPLCSALSSH